MKHRWLNIIQINYKWTLISILLSVCAQASPPLSVSNDNEDAKIVLFEIIPSKTTKPDQYTYHWKVINSSRVRLFRDEKELLSRQSFLQGENVGWDNEVSNISIRINKNARYRLVAESLSGDSVSKIFNMTKHNGNKEKSMSDREKLHLRRKNQVALLKQKKSLQPLINSFRISPSSPEAREFITFHWDITNAHEVNLYDEYGKIDFRSDGPARNGINSWFSTTIDKDSRFRLEIIDVHGTKVSREIQVKLRDSGVCSITGKLEGLWKRKVQERFNGPTTEEKIPIFIRETDEKQAFAKAVITSAGSYSMGRYYFKNLKSGKSYLINSGWKTSPNQIEVYCKKGANKEGSKFRILR